MHVCAIPLRLRLRIAVASRPQARPLAITYRAGYMSVHSACRRPTRLRPHARSLSRLLCLYIHDSAVCTFRLSSVDPAGTHTFMICMYNQLLQRRPGVFVCLRFVSDLRPGATFSTYGLNRRHMYDSSHNAARVLSLPFQGPGIARLPRNPCQSPVERNGNEIGLWRVLLWITESETSAESKEKGVGIECRSKCM